MVWTSWFDDEAADHRPKPKCPACHGTGRYGDADCFCLLMVSREGSTSPHGSVFHAVTDRKQSSPAPAGPDLPPMEFPGREGEDLRERLRRIPDADAG